jgi:hypothetical protein
MTSPPGAPSQKPRRDIFDILSVGGTLFSTVILGLLTILFTARSNDVKDSLQNRQASISKAELVHTLITDLKTNDTGQDIALIGLNRSIGDLQDESGNERLMVLQIADTVFSKRLGDTKFKKDDRATLVALQVMRERCDKNDKTLHGWCTDIFESDKEQYDNLPRAGAAVSNEHARPTETTKPVASPAPGHSTPPKHNGLNLTSAFSAVVYIQYAADSERQQVEDLRTDLNHQPGATITVPPIDHKVADYSDSVRYFHAEDRDVADRIADIANKSFKGAKNFKPPTLFGPRDDVPLGQVEIWIK